MRSSSLPLWIGFLACVAGCEGSEVDQMSGDPGVGEGELHMLGQTTNPCPVSSTDLTVWHNAGVADHELVQVCGANKCFGVGTATAADGTKDSSNAITFGTKLNQVLHGVYVYAHGTGIVVPLQTACGHLRIPLDASTASHIVPMRFANGWPSGAIDMTWMVCNTGNGASGVGYCPPMSTDIYGVKGVPSGTYVGWDGSKASPNWGTLAGWSGVPANTWNGFAGWNNYMNWAGPYSASSSTAWVAFEAW